MAMVAESLAGQDQQWSTWLQRRLIRLLLIHDRGLFRSQFRTFFVESTLPQIPLLQQYDRYIKLITLSDELLDDILPRVRRQLSLQTDHARLCEEAPTRGDVDWHRTINRTLRETPGLPPTRFDTRLRLRSTATPENLFTVAVLLAFRRELDRLLREEMDDEALNDQERQVLVSADERAERELAAPYARDLIDRASCSDAEALAEHVMAHLRPGSNPYRDLLNWWQSFQNLGIGYARGQTRLALVSSRHDEKVNAWLYELWIALELLNLLHGGQAINPADTAVEQDRLSFCFTWNGRRFRFRYNRKLEDINGNDAAWEHGPHSRPDYTIERITPLHISSDGKLIWREPPFIIDAKYYLAGSDPTRTHGPIKKLLGDMTLLGVEQGILFFPLLPDPQDEGHITRTIKRQEHTYRADMASELQIHLYHISPDFSLHALQERLRAVLDQATAHLPERADPICEGMWLDPDTVNASGIAPSANLILCPKRHIGPHVFDLVHADTQCLKDPRVCHVIGQGVTRPEVIRVTTRDGLQNKSKSVRSRNDEQLQQAEQSGNEDQAEQLRQQIFESIGSATEQYVKLRGDTQHIEDTFKNWIFREYWKDHKRALAPKTRDILLSGEYVWYEYQKVDLTDWAAPAVQYCRALEFEFKRRIYYHHPAPPKGAAPDPSAFKVSRAGWTLGSLKQFCMNLRTLKGDQLHNWHILKSILQRAGCDVDALLKALEDFKYEEIANYRNALAHGDLVTRSVAEDLRNKIIGVGGQLGLLSWLALHLDPAKWDTK